MAFRTRQDCVGNDEGTVGKVGEAALKEVATPIEKLGSVASCLTGRLAVETTPSRTLIRCGNPVTSRP